MRYEHMSWCEQNHKPLTNCEAVRAIGGLEIAIVGAPCCSADVEIGGQLSELDENGIQEVINTLASFQSLLRGSRGETDCSAHDHSDNV